jgi:hypothetical protein
MSKREIYRRSPLGLNVFGSLRRSDRDVIETNDDENEGRDEANASGAATKNLNCHVAQLATVPFTINSTSVHFFNWKLFNQNGLLYGVCFPFFHSLNIQRVSRSSSLSLSVVHFQLIPRSARSET